MKYIYLLFFAFSLSIFSQSSVIDNGYWTLYNLKVNSQDDFNPLRSDGNPIISEFNTNSMGETYFTTWICDSWFNNPEIDTEKAIIKFFGLGSTLGGCHYADNITPEYINNIDNKFKEFFSGTNNETKTFNYDITEDSLNNRMILVITDSNGDYAEYHLSTLSTSNNTLNIPFSIYPNPVSNNLNIYSRENIGDFNLSIFDFNGKLLMNNLELDSKSINIEKLPSGLYFLAVEDKLGKTVTKKFIKQ